MELIWKAGSEKFPGRTTFPIPCHQKAVLAEYVQATHHCLSEDLSFSYHFTVISVKSTFSARSKITGCQCSLEEKRKRSNSSEDHLVSSTFFSFSGKTLFTAFHYSALFLGWLWWGRKYCSPSFAFRRENRNSLETQRNLLPCPVIFGPHYSSSLSSPHLERRRGAENLLDAFLSMQGGAAGCDAVVALFSLHHLWGRECKAPRAMDTSWVVQDWQDVEFLLG